MRLINTLISSIQVLSARLKNIHLKNSLLKIHKVLYELDAPLHEDSELESILNKLQETIESIEKIITKDPEPSQEIFQTVQSNLETILAILLQFQEKHSLSVFVKMSGNQSQSHLWVNQAVTIPENPDAHTISFLAQEMKKQASASKDIPVEKTKIVVSGNNSHISKQTSFLLQVTPNPENKGTAFSGDNSIMQLSQSPVVAVDKGKKPAVPVRTTSVTKPFTFSSDGSRNLGSSSSASHSSSSSNSSSAPQKIINVAGNNNTYMESVGQHIEVKQPQPPATRLPQAWNLPLVNTNFFMRKVIEGIRDALEKQQPGQPLILVAVSGLGGIGKTELARHYIHHPKKSYNAKLWFRASSPRELIQEYRELCMRLYLGVDEKTSGPEVVKIMNEFLIEHPGWLMVVDNADDNAIQMLLPSQSGDVLITSRQPNWRGQCIEVDVLDSDEAVAFYKQLSGKSQEDEKIVDQLVKVLGYLPVAIAQATAYVKNTKISTEEYLTNFNQYKALMLQENALPAITQEERNRLTIMTTWNLSLDAIEEHHQINSPHLPFYAKTLIMHLAFLVSIGIPKSLLLRMVSEAYPQFPHTLVLNKAIAELLSHSLIQADETFVHMHPLLQEVIRIQNPLDQNRFEIIANALSLEGETDPYQSMNEIIRLIKLIPHEEILLQYHDKIQPPFEQTCALTNLLICLQDHYHLQRNIQARKTALERLLPLYKTGFGIEHPEMANLLNGLGDTLYQLGHYDDARNILQRALEIKQKNFGAEHIELAAILNTLSHVLFKLDDKKAAYDMLQHALIIQKQHYKNEEHITIADTLINLGRLLRDLGNKVAACDMLKQGIAIQERYYQDNRHIALANPLTQLALAVGSLGDIKAQRDTLQRALLIKEHYHGHTHPEVAMLQGNLALTYMELDNKTQAQHLVQEAIKKVEQFSGYGINHPYYQQLQQIQQSIQGYTPPTRHTFSFNLNDFILVLMQIAEAKSTQGQYEEALMYYHLSCNIFEQHAPQHPNYPALLLRMGKTYYQIDKKLEAIQSVGKGLCLSVKLKK